jgi:hypothetical protein
VRDVDVRGDTRNSDTIWRVDGQQWIDMRFICSMAIVVAAGCGEDIRSVGLFGTGEGGVQETDSDGVETGGGEGSGSTESSASSAGESEDDEAGGPKLDVGNPGTGGEGADEAGCVTDCGCTAVDLLFVIDNSTSMNDYQVALGQAFPGFADAIIAALPSGTSLHVGVTSTEMGYSNAGSTMNCEATGNGLPQEEFYLTPDAMDSGKNGAQGRLYVADGMPFFAIETDAPESEVQALRDWFSSASNIGEGGSNVEMSSAAAGWAFDPTNAGANAGFLRDEGAVLVVFFLQDEPDQSDAPGMTMQEVGQDMLDKIAAAKSGCGGLMCVVAGGFVDQGCLDQNGLGVLLDGLPAPAATAELPDEDEVGPGDFAPLLEDTLTQVIAQTCDEIEPEG